MSNLDRLMKKFPLHVDGAKVDALLIKSLNNRFYLNNFKSSEGFVFMTNTKAYFLVDSRYYELANKCIENMTVLESSDLKTGLNEIVKKHDVKNILIENEEITLSLASTLEGIAETLKFSILKSNVLDKVMMSMREIKDNVEIEKIKKAQKITEDAFNYILSKIRVGVKEKDLALEIEFYMRKNGADSIAFDLIVLSGSNGSIPHGAPRENTVKNGDFITIDIGAVFEGYSSDMTRTVAIGEITEEQKSVYSTVLKAQMKALSKIKSGVSCLEVDRAARDVIDSSDYRGCFKHSIGHGIGISVHERPRFSSDCILKPGMVITVEPGIYIDEKLGVRIEDMVIVTETGYENLTYIPKDLIVI